MGSQESTTRKISIENDEDLETPPPSLTQTIVIQTISNPDPEKLKNEPKEKELSDAGDDEKSAEENPGKKKELSEKELNLQYVETLKTNKENWNRKIQDLKEKHEKIYSDYIEEYQKAVTFVKDHSPKERNKNAAVPCKAIKEKVLKCYQNNKTETLVCSGLVQEFMKCLDEARCDVMEKK